MRGKACPMVEVEAKGPCVWCDIVGGRSEADGRVSVTVVVASRGLSSLKVSKPANQLA